MVEILLGICWSLSYLLIVYGGFRYKSENRIFMPLIAGALNFAWEILALKTSGGHWAHIVWLVLDCFILFQNLFFLSTAKNRLLYGGSVVAVVVLLFFFFKIDVFDGMLVSSFAIDIIMACEYLFVIKKLSPRLIVFIGVFRLLGDLFAWIGNIRSAVFVTVVGAVVLTVNLAYISLAVRITLNNRKAAVN